MASRGSEIEIVYEEIDGSIDTEDYIQKKAEDYYFQANKRAFGYFRRGTHSLDLFKQYRP